MRVSAVFWLSTTAVPAAAYCLGYRQGTASAAAAVLLVLVSLALWPLRALASSFGGGKRLVLHTILPSHFVESVRWCLDRTGIDYTERPTMSVIGVLILGRTVPALDVGPRTTLGTSVAIRRWLFGTYGTDANAEFLRPTPDRLAMEETFNAYGVALQRWVYYNMLMREGQTWQMLEAWGSKSPRLPLWQRLLGVAMFPFVTKRFMIRAFGLAKPDSYPRAQQSIERTLGEVEAKLKDRRRFLEAGAVEPSYVDIHFAALSALWVVPEGYARGMAPKALTDMSCYPAAALHDREKWMKEFPLTTAHVQRVYQQRNTVHAVDTTNVMLL